MLLTVTTLFVQHSAFAQSVRKFADKPITVRLCPATCRAVDGHGLKPGANVSVLESQSGWARVSAYLDRGALVPRFGDKITKRPALWVPMTSLLTEFAGAPAPKESDLVVPSTSSPVAETVSDNTPIVRLQRIPSPVFRPGEKVDQPVQAAVSEPVAPKKTEEAVPVTKPAKKPVVAEAAPVKAKPKSTGPKKKTLTWEEVQAKIAAQAAGAKQPAAPAKQKKPQSDAEKADKKAKKVKPAAEPTTNSITRPKKVKPEKDSSLDPKIKTAKAHPPGLSARPKILTNELLDNRLSELPGPKSKVNKQVVIALRHYALGLLDSGECDGIAKGGASAVPGMLYVACIDDPTYLRQFPLTEETW